MKHVQEFQKKSGIELPKFADDFVRRAMMNLKNHDAETYEHCLRVSEMTLQLAINLKLNILEQSLSLYAGLLHDVGKLKVPVYIINKPTRLSEQEYDIMKKHADYGMDIISPLTVLPFFKKVSEAILYHHERVDGQGYHKLSSDKIPLISKMILVVDTVDAMSQDRAYRKGLAMNVVVEELIRCSGTQFDPQVVDVYLESLQKKKSEQTKAA